MLLVLERRTQEAKGKCFCSTHCRPTSSTGAHTSVYCTILLLLWCLSSAPWWRGGCNCITLAICLSSSDFHGTRHAHRLFEKEGRSPRPGRTTICMYRMNHRHVQLAESGDRLLFSRSKANKTFARDRVYEYRTAKRVPNEEFRYSTLEDHNAMTSTIPSKRCYCIFCARTWCMYCM